MEFLRPMNAYRNMCFNWTNMDCKNGLPFRINWSTAEISLKNKIISCVKRRLKISIPCLWSMDPIIDVNHLKKTGTQKSLRCKMSQKSSPKFVWNNLGEKKVINAVTWTKHSKLSGAWATEWHFEMYLPLQVRRSLIFILCFQMCWKGRFASLLVHTALTKTVEIIRKQKSLLNIKCPYFQAVMDYSVCSTGKKGAPLYTVDFFNGEISSVFNLLSARSNSKVYARGSRYGCQFFVCSRFYW